MCVENCFQIKIKKNIMSTIKSFEEYTDLTHDDVFGFEDGMMDHLNEIAEIGYFGKGEKLDFVVFIWSRDPGYIPHFHIDDSETYPKCTKFQTCLKIESPEYFTHGGKYTDQLNTNQLDQLIEFLKMEDEEGESNWKYLLKTWNKNSSKMEMKVILKQEMPDYTVLKGTNKKK